MKVGIVSQYWYDRGGTEVLARNLAAALVGQGHDVTLLYLDVANRTSVDRPGMPGTVLPAGVWDRALQALDVWGAQEVVFLLDLRNGLTEPISRHPSTARRTLYVNINNAEGQSLKASPQLAGQLRATVLRFDRVAVFFEGSVASQVLRDWHVPYRVAGTGIPPVGPVSAGNFRARHGIRADETVLLCVGLVAPLKFQVEMLQVFPPQSGQRLVFIGDIYTGTPDYGLAFGDAVLARPDCVWLDGVPRDEVLTAMAAANLLLFPSQSEGAPLVLLESMALGLPWITTPAIDFARELAGGVIIPLAGFRAAVDALLQAPDYRQRLADEGRAAQASRWNLDVTAATFASWFAMDSTTNGLLPADIAAMIDTPWSTVTSDEQLDTVAAEWMVLTDGPGTLTAESAATLPALLTAAHDAVILFRAPEPPVLSEASIVEWMRQGVAVFAIRTAWWRQHRRSAPTRQPSDVWQAAMVAWLTQSARCHLGSNSRALGS